ncbi:DNA glycosylase AlkZ-like family protein [Halalkalibacillus halophilus]|uniref:DNA glycosylase AlkZ-like family protein n=1 Tax=Halalkalibacillus halophilus TaxID=392827 RepID=UPI00041EAE32|nr:crosslink repair DNA glycosylase YcaQ family protein [Halalkalibacillus halophilus]
MDKTSILQERLLRQGLLKPLTNPNDETAYLELLKKLQPVAPVHFGRPGNPPKLVHRTTFNDELLSEKLREKHHTVKARFQGGRIAYVVAEYLNLYAGVYRKPIQKHKETYDEIHMLIKQSGGIDKEQLREALDYPSKEINPALKKLQEAFVVYEDQIDTDWNTGWFDFETEWFEINLGEPLEKAAAKIVQRFLEAYVFASFDEIKEWSQLKKTTLKQALDYLVEEGEAQQVDAQELGEGYMLVKDLSVTHNQIDASVFMLDKSDFLVRANLHVLKELFQGEEILQYLLIDGEFKGAVIGHWRIGPHDVEDIKLTLPKEEASKRKEEILAAVRKGYSQETTAILNYNGENL